VTADATAATLRLEAAVVGDLARVRDFVRRVARELEVPRDLEPDLVIGVDETLTNVLLHGYDGVAGPVEIGVVRRGDEVVIRLRDWAPAFDPTTWPEPYLSVPFDRRPKGGLGIHLTRACLDRIDHRQIDGGNELVLVKSLASGGSNA